MPTKSSSPTKVKPQNLDDATPPQDCEETPHALPCDFDEIDRLGLIEIELPDRSILVVTDTFTARLGYSNPSEYLHDLLALRVVTFMPRCRMMGAILMERHWHLAAPIETFADLNSGNHFPRLSPDHCHRAIPIGGHA